ncbi:MAG: thioesterase family protein, partial [Acidimicrobiia bacterium]|nr:thioesterase family protein [Acidimicrobiia bacterium]
MSFQFDLATQVQPIGDGRFSAHVHDGWDIGGNANGGYLLALVAAALCGAAGRPLPVALSCH